MNNGFTIGFWKGSLKVTKERLEIHFRDSNVNINAMLGYNNNYKQTKDFIELLEWLVLKLAHTNSEWQFDDLFQEIVYTKNLKQIKYEKLMVEERR